MSIPDITTSNPLNAALESAERDTLDVSSVHVPLVMTPQSLIQQQQFELDQNRALNNMVWGSGELNPLGKAIMPSAMETGYIAGKDTLATDKNFGNFNQAFNRRFYDEHANKEQFPTYQSWIERGTGYNIQKGLQNRSVDIKAD